MEHELTTAVSTVPYRMRRLARPALRAAATKLATIASGLIIASAATLTCAGTAHAGLDHEKSATDRSGHRLTVQQWDTVFHPVAPMDKNRLTREWFFSGRTAFQVTGEGSEAFSGTLDFGYQVGIPWSVGVGVNFSYTTPNIMTYDAPITDPLLYVITPDLFPGVTFSTDIGNGPGVQELVTASVPVSGAAGTVALANGHGTVTGVAGGVQVRAFARLTWPDHASITTYGPLWNVD